MSLEHILRNGRQGGDIRRNADEYITAACALTKRYRFDGFVCAVLSARKETDLSDWFDFTFRPVGDASHILANEDPEKWPRDSSAYTAEDFYCTQLARELLGPDIHVGGYTGDGFSKAVQWFPSIEDALIAMQTDPGRFEALVRYCDDWCIAVGVGLITLGGCESMQVSSPYAGSSFISRAHYERLVLPSAKRVSDALQAAGAFTYLHTCGSINDRLELMADTGVHGIECMDPPPLGDTELRDAKRRVGSRVCLKGNLDSPHLLWQGCDQEVDRTVRETIEAGMPGGGYILSTACSAAPLVSASRMERLIEYAERYGRY